MSDDERKLINAKNLKDPFYDSPSWGLGRAGGGEDDKQDATQSMIVLPRRIQAYTVYQRSLDLPSVASLAPLFQLLPTAINNAPLIATAAGIISISISLKTAVQAEFGVAECLTRGTPTSVLTTFAPNVVSMAQAGWRPTQGPCNVIAGFGATNGWSVAPTFPLLNAGGSADGVQYEQVILPAIIGSSVSWNYGVDDPLIVHNLVSDSGSSGNTPKGLVVWNQGGAASPAVRATIRWVEFNSGIAPYIWQ